ncbi:2,5-diketo-D-gluconate reductase B [Caballeronia pedi]|uniref:2,5-diketo-D-gluconate reductase B n=1 Tax=Caballeronia pedi TaxID=1777141 RepID=A0A158BPI4_9BURK|nr:aldo/keto reductase [Caballeronia pedi]SAK71995.1 2,5-diketo-D-gluconate reductase B [Caballeronia pedi]
MNILFERTHQRSFGTWPLNGRQLLNALQNAIETGYRAIDTAQLYDNETGVGSSLRAIGIPRRELCITTKIAPANDSDERFMPSLRESLEKLKIDQADVLLLHWPPADGDVAPSVRRLEQAARAGLTRHIGVSNFTAAMMRAARAATALPLVTNQVEFHPLLNQRVLLDTASETGIPLSSYCSVARGEIFNYPLFGEIGARYGKSAAQVALRWILQQGVPINTMSTQRRNIEANFDVMDFTLSSIDMHRIDALTGTNYRIVNRERVPLAPEFD